MIERGPEDFPEPVDLTATPAGAYDPGAPSIQRPPFLQSIAEAMNYLDQAKDKAWGSFLAAVAKNEIGEPLEQYQDSLASFDAPTTEASKLRLEQQLALLMYHESLAEAGLKLDENPFNSGLDIINGQKFAAMLASAQPDDKAILQGSQTILARALDLIEQAYIPLSIDQEDIPDWHTNPQLQPEIAESEAATQAHNARVTDILINAGHIVQNLQNLNGDAEIIANLERAQVAEVEGLLPHFAVAWHLNLYESAVGDLEPQWSTWIEPGEWQTFFDFIESAQAKAPPNSRFMKDIAVTMLRNIAEHRAQLVSYEYEEIVTEDGTRQRVALSEEDIAFYQAADQRYNEQLDAAESLLQRLLGS